MLTWFCTVARSRAGSRAARSATLVKPRADRAEVKAALVCDYSRGQGMQGHVLGGVRGCGEVLA